MQGVQAGVDHGLAAKLMPHDGRAGQQIVAVGVVAVVVGVDQRAYGQVGDAADGAEEGAGAGFGKAGIHHGNRAAPGDEAGVIQAPTAI